MGHRELQGHVPAPGVPDNDGPVQAHPLDESQQVVGHRGEVVAFFGFGALAVAPLVQRHHGVVPGQDGGRQVPDMTGGGQPVQEYQGAAGAAPVPVVEIQTVDGYAFVVGVLGQVRSSRTTMQISGDALQKGRFAWRSPSRYGLRPAS